MKCWCLMCLLVGIVLNDEVLGWICLVLAAVPPFLSLMAKYAELIANENRKLSPSEFESGIDDDGFYY